MIALLLAIQAATTPAPSEPVIPEPALIVAAPADASKPVQTTPPVTWSVAVQQASNPAPAPARAATAAAALLNAAIAPH